MIMEVIGPFHTQNVEKMTRIEERIIGIDGNGTGRIGAVQRIERRMEADAKLREVEMNKMTTFMRDVSDTLTTLHAASSGSVKTKTLWAIAASVGVMVLGLAGTLAAGWVQHAMGWK